MKGKPKIGIEYILTNGQNFTPVKMEQSKHIKPTTVHDYSLQHHNSERVYVDINGNRAKKSRFKDEK